MGWEWTAWEQAFYPEDMPTEWRLTFYNTQFQCVFVPLARWRGAGDAAFAQWAQDTHDRFLFLLERDGDAYVPAALSGKAKCVSAQDGCITWFDRRSDIKQLADTLRQPSRDARYLLSRDGDLAQVERVRTLMELLGLAV